MKRKITTLIVLLMISFLNKSIIAQTNSVRLDGSTLFNGITAAYNSLGGTISAPHIIEMLGSYTAVNETFPISLTQKIGSSAINTITIRPATGSYDLVINDSQYETDQGIIVGLTQPLISFNGAKFVILDGRAGGTGTTISLTIKNSNTGINSGTIIMQNGASNNTVKYVNCYEPGALFNTLGGRNIHIAQSNSGTGGNNNNTIDHCIINGGRRGVQTFGTGGDTGYTNNNTIITNNIIKNQTSIGIFLGSEAIGNTVTGNEIFMDTAVATASTYIGINCQSVGTNDIKANKIHSITSSNSSYSLTGIQTIPATLTASGSNLCTINLINNMASIFDENDLAQGIIIINIANVISGAAYTANVYNNSLLVGGTAANITTTSIALSVNQGNTADRVSQLSSYNGFNNLAINHRNGGNVNTVHIGVDFPGGLITLGQSDHNTYMATDSVHGSFARINGVIYITHATVCDTCATIEDFLDSCCRENTEMHSTIKDVALVSTTDLHLVAGRTGGDMNGTPLAEVTTDIDGTLRNLNYPYRGADEGASLKVLSVRALFQGIIIGARTGIIVVGSYALRNAVAPYEIKSTCSSDLDNQSKAHLCFGDSIPIGSNFYIVVNQRNHLETWSASPTHFSSGTGEYIFDAALSYAYGNNMYGTSAPYQIYGGDVDQNGNINLTDVVSIYNDAVHFTTGCNIDTDINNDGIVDLADLTITYNNAISFVSLMRP